MNQYQRYQLRNDKIVADLKEKIRVLIEEPESEEAQMLRISHDWPKQKRCAFTGGMSTDGFGQVAHPFYSSPSDITHPAMNSYKGDIDPYATCDTDSNGHFVVKKKSVWWNPKTWLS